MLSDHEQAEAYAFLLDAIEELESLLTLVEGAFLEEDWATVKKMGEKLTKAREILEP